MGKAVMGTCDYDNCTFVGETKPVHITIDGTDWDGDLCPEHTAPVTQLVDNSHRPRQMGGRNRVYTIEEIEKMKRGNG